MYLPDYSNPEVPEVREDLFDAILWNPQLNELQSVGPRPIINHGTMRPVFEFHDHCMRSSDAFQQQMTRRWPFGTLGVYLVWVFPAESQVDIELGKGLHSDIVPVMPGVL